MIRRTCPRCGNKVEVGKECKCNDSARKKRDREYYRQRKDVEEQRIYTSSRWKKVRDKAMERDVGMCRCCFKKGEIRAAEVIHHIEPIKEGGSIYDLNNLIAMCAKCHNKTHKIYESNERMEEIKRLAGIPPVSKNF
ncbi:MAG: HNH endonuclease [Eubacterium aggregans]|uniref:HNH endonuclease n=1 Tax=Eubacterium aggregans TaxID=81409 RepID=UPI002B21AF04|nr:HNH endonuclease [Eubacterium aggregans]MEA5073084.1 HNH endonuclease [Eubacterium aggregans]